MNLISCLGLLTWLDEAVLYNAVAAVEDLDIKTAFLNGIVEEEVYIEQPAGYEEDGTDIGCHVLPPQGTLRTKASPTGLAFLAE